VGTIEPIVRIYEKYGAAFTDDRRGGIPIGGNDDIGAGDAAPQIGPMLRSVLRLLEEIELEELLSLPLPPLPVRFHELPDGRIYLDVLVTLAGEENDQREAAVGLLRDRGLRVTTVAGNIVAGNVDVANVALLAVAVGEDAFIEAAGAVWPELDVSVPEVWGRGSGAQIGDFTGRGVVVGIVDSGVDVSHPSLRTVSGGTRILALWDQTLRGLSAPPGDYGYGSEWDASAIDAHLLATPPVAFPSADTTGHGTAVAGIAVSNGLAAPAGRYVGIAPDADIAVVVLEARPGALATSENVIDAVNYVFQVAAVLGKRAVVNISQGAQIGPHDPTGQFEQAIAGLLTLDAQRVVVTSIGNTGAADAHARLDVRTDSFVDLAVDVPRYAGPVVVIDIWYDVGDLAAIELADPAGNSTAIVTGSQNMGGRLGNDAWEIDGLLNVLQVRANWIQVKLRTAHRTGDVSPGTWTVRVHGAYMTTGEPVHAWLERGRPGSSPRFLAFHDPDVTLTAPAGANEVLAVGSYTLSPTLGPLSDFSGRGPTRSGSALSHICAPGAPVTTLAPSSTHAVAHTPHRGTSFAAAHVTGAIALILEANNALTRSQLQDCLLMCARMDADTLAGPSTGWGSGKLDIAAALQCAAASTNEGPIS
jgi:subtilisin family serine protease